MSARAPRQQAVIAVGPLRGTVNLILPVAFAGVVVLLCGFGFQVWIASLQIRRFLHWFSGRPDADEQLGRLFDVYTWRARLAVSLFRIQLPPGFVQERRTSDQAHPLPSWIETVIVMLILVALLGAVGGFTLLVSR